MVNVDVTAPGATIALALMFLKVTIQNHLLFADLKQYNKITYILKLN